MAAGMAQSSANGDAMDTMFAQGYVYGIARQVSDLNTEDFTDALKRRSFDEAKMRLEGLEEDVRDFVAEMREEEPNDSVKDDMALVQAATAHAQAFGKLLPDLEKSWKCAATSPTKTAIRRNWTQRLKRLTTNIWR